MKVHGVEITAEQIIAGLGAMAGQFRMMDVRGAMERAGVKGTGVVDRASDRLLQRERKAGRIRAVTNRLWEVCAARRIEAGTGETVKQGSTAKRREPGPKDAPNLGSHLMTSSKLKPCPFCGGENVELYSPALSRLISVHCAECEIQGQKAGDAELAIMFWNTRASEGDNNASR